MMCKPKKMLISNNSVLENSFLFWHVHTWRSALFSLDRCVTWRSLRRVDIRPCRGCATSPKMEVGEEFSNTYAKCPYVQLLGNSWAMQCNAVGTNLELMQFYEKGIQCRTWGSVATSCEMCESELFFFFLSSLIFILRLPRLHMLGLFANVATNCQTSSSHFLCIPFILGG